MKSSLSSLVGRRGRSVLTAGSWSLVAKTAGAANLFVSVPFVLADLGPELFGGWATLVSLTTVVSFLDFGFGYGAMNLAAAAIGRGEEQDVAKVARASFKALFRIMVVALIAGWASLPIVPWHRLLGLTDASVRQATFAAAIVLTTIALSIPLNLSNRLQLGVGQGQRAFRWQALGQVISLAATLIVARQGGSLAACVAATVATPLISSAANTISFYRKTRSDVGGDTANVGAAIRREGSQFFILQLAAVLAFGIDLPLIAAFKGPEAAGQYAIVQRLFSVVPMTLALLWAPLWPMYRQSIAAGDFRWIFRTLRRAVLLAATFTAFGGLTILLLFQPLSKIWLHATVSASAVLLCGFAVWCVLEGIGTAIATFFNSASIVDFQVATSCVFATLCVGCKIVAVRTVGADAVPWATTFTYIVSSVIPFLIYRKQIMRRVLAMRPRRS